jgi:hypothetical protein
MAHIPGYNFCGPGTYDFSKNPVNSLDWHCRVHDSSYRSVSDYIYYNQADEDLLRGIDSITGPSASLVRGIFMTKRRLTDYFRRRRRHPYSRGTPGRVRFPVYLRLPPTYRRGTLGGPYGTRVAIDRAGPRRDSADSLASLLESLRGGHFAQRKWSGTGGRKAPVNYVVGGRRRRRKRMRGRSRKRPRSVQLSVR